MSCLRKKVKFVRKKKILDSEEKGNGRESKKICVEEKKGMERPKAIM